MNTFTKSIDENNFISIIQQKSLRVFLFVSKYWEINVSDKLYKLFYSLYWIYKNTPYKEQTHIDFLKLKKCKKNEKKASMNKESCITQKALWKRKSKRGGNTQDKTLLAIEWLCTCNASTPVDISYSVWIYAVLLLLGKPSKDFNHFCGESSSWPSTLVLKKVISIRNLIMLFLFIII